jgi:hypothetical protein
MRIVVSSEGGFRASGGACLLAVCSGWNQVLGKQVLASNYVLASLANKHHVVVSSIIRLAIMHELREAEKYFQHIHNYTTSIYNQHQSSRNCVVSRKTCFIS